MDITGDSQYQCWNLVERDTEKVKALLTGAQKYEALEMKEALARDGLKGWWYGAYSMADEKFMAVAYITDAFVYLYGREKTAMRCIGRNMGRNTVKRSGASHSIFGPDDMVQAFWNGFEVSGKKVMSEERLSLCELTQVECKQNDAYAVRVAVAKDLPLVFEFLGEALIDELGIDVRRVGKDAHERYCSEHIAAGSIVLGTHRGKPAFLCEVRTSEMGTFIEHAHFPVAMRRPKVMRGIHARLAELLLPNTETLLMHVNDANEDLKASLREVGYHAVSIDRLIRLK